GGWTVAKRVASKLLETTQTCRAQSAVDGDRFVCLVVDVSSQGGVRTELWRGRRVAAAAHGQAAQRRVKKMCGDVLDLPLGRDGLPLPVPGREREQQFEQQAIDPGEKMRRENGF